jgi:hypothetical protein
MAAVRIREVAVRIREATKVVIPAEAVTPAAVAAMTTT